MRGRLRTKSISKNKVEHQVKEAPGYGQSKEQLEHAEIVCCPEAECQVKTDQTNSVCDFTEQKAG